MFVFYFGAKIVCNIGNTHFSNVRDTLKDFGLPNMKYYTPSTLEIFKPIVLNKCPILRIQNVIDFFYTCQNHPCTFHVDSTIYNGCNPYGTHTQSTPDMHYCT